MKENYRVGKIREWKMNTKTEDKKKEKRKFSSPSVCWSQFLKTVICETFPPPSLNGCWNIVTSHITRLRKHTVWIFLTTNSRYQHLEFSNNEVNHTKKKIQSFKEEIHTNRQHLETVSDLFQRITVTRDIQLKTTIRKSSQRHIFKGKKKWW